MDGFARPSSVCASIRLSASRRCWTIRRGRVRSYSSTGKGRCSGALLRRARSITGVSRRWHPRSPSARGSVARGALQAASAEREKRRGEEEMIRFSEGAGFVQLGKDSGRRISRSTSRRTRSLKWAGGERLPKGIFSA
jgi:hypothetical protein